MQTKKGNQKQHSMYHMGCPNCGTASTAQLSNTCVIEYRRGTPQGSIPTPRRSAATPMACFWHLRDIRYIHISKKTRCSNPYRRYVRPLQPSQCSPFPAIAIMYPRTNDNTPREQREYTAPGRCNLTDLLERVLVHIWSPPPQTSGNDAADDKPGLAIDLNYV